MSLYLVVLVVLSSYLFFMQMVEGNISDFDCIDIYKQPAFQHPLLKNHKIQEKFSSDGSLNNKNKYQTNYQICPKGTVPILRQKNETKNVHLNTDEYPGQHFATIETVLDGSIYRGAQADISTHDFTIQNNQYSKSQIWLQNGPRNQLNSIQFGWAIHPRLYGESVTRVTTYWTADGYKRTGCYNIQCPGFVLVSRIHGLGGKFQYASIYGKRTNSFTPQVFQDGFSGNWVLKVSDEVIGYWPKELFTHLNKGASLVRFGGNTYLSPDGISPPMGNGYFPVMNLDKCAHMSHVKVRNSKYQLVDVEDGRLRQYSDSYECYRLSYWGYIKSMRVFFLFGGPGGNCGI